MTFTEKEQAIADKASGYARSIKKTFAKKFTDKAIYLPEEHPVSVFMAGSPGAGKTEVSKQLLHSIGDSGINILRIDPDELRGEFEDYNGKNAYLFQAAVSLLVEKIHDYALKQRQSFILDGTLSHYSVAEKNIERSLSKSRYVQILYVYQEPMQAWEFVQAREALEGRNIKPERFMEQYFDARQVVNKLKETYGKAVNIDLLMKNIDGSNRMYKAGVDLIDSHIPEKYTRADIEAMLIS